MWLTIGNVNTQLANATPEEREFVSNYLSFEDDRARYMRGGERLCLLNTWNSSFPTGFVPLLKKAAEAEGLKVSLIDKRVKPCEFDASADLAWLRPYQRAGVDRIVERGRGIVSSATGSGKSEIAVGIVRALPCRWLFVVHRTGLVQQAADRYDLRAKEHGTGAAPAGRIGEGSWSVDDHFTCASFQTLYAGLKSKNRSVKELLLGAQGLVIDESHVVPSNSFLAVVNAAQNAYWRVGLSGTPLARGDRKSIYSIGAIGPIVHKVTADELIKAGVLARPKVRMVRCFQRIGATTWPAVYAKGVANSAQRNALVVDLVRRAEKPALVFVTEIAHGKQLVRDIGCAGIMTDFANGEHSADWNASLLKRMLRGALDVVVCSIVFQEGIDVPDLRSVIVATGGKSVIGALQRIGRGMRKAFDAHGNTIKDTFEVWDVLDEGNKWLAKHARDRRAAYMNQAFEVVIE